MSPRLHPGVYVEEVAGGARSIEGASTSTVIFIGETERGPDTPTRIKSRSDYERSFGGYMRHTAGEPVHNELTYAIDAFYKNGGRDAYVLRAVAPSMGGPAGEESPSAASRWIGPNGGYLDATSKGSWGNHIVPVLCTSSDGALDGDPPTPQRFRIVVRYRSADTGKDEIVEDWDRLTALDPTDENYVVDVLLRSKYIRWRKQYIGATPEFALDLGASELQPGKRKHTDDQILAVADAARMTGGSGGEDELSPAHYAALLARLDQVTDASLLVAPGKFNDFGRPYQGELASYVASRPRRDLFYIADLPPIDAGNVTSTVSELLDQHWPGTVKNDFTAAYFPWVTVADPVGSGKNPTRLIAPSGFVAGIYARTDARRGVWKSPAGLEASIGGVVGLQYEILDSHQDDLNIKGINVLRTIPAAGPVIWGTRTTMPSTEWRYIPVRRTAMFLRKSIYDGIQWAVFEPNGEELWASLRATISAFMEQQFRQGAFAGTKSSEAYFVKCNAETTTPEDEAAGIVNVLVGFAPRRPAEFVVVKLSQKLQSSEG
jgi:hypothetical protein